MSIRQEIGIRITATGAQQAQAELGRVATGADRIASSADDAISKLRGFAGAIAVGALVREFVQAGDQINLTNARLKLATGSVQEFVAAQADIYRIAQANNVGLEETTQLYTKLSEPIKRLGGTSKEVAAVTESFALSLRLGGASAQEASAATLQFAQAMASGKLQGDEFRSLAEASPRFMKALAEGMGVPIEALKKLGTEGALTADIVGNALVSGLSKLQTEAQGLPDTVGGAMTRLKNEALIAVGAFDQVSGATSGLAGIIGGVAEVVGSFGKALRDIGSDGQQMAGGISAADAALLVVGTTFETLVVMAAEVGYMFKAVGTEIGGLVAQFSALGEGGGIWTAEGRNAWTAVGEAMREDAKASRAELDRFTSRVAGTTQRLIEQRAAVSSHSLSVSENAAKMAKLTRQQGDAGTGYRTLKGATEGATKAAKKQADEAAKLLTSYGKLADASQARIVTATAEVESGRKLTKSEEEWITVFAAVRDGKVSLAALERAGTVEKLRANVAAEQAIALAGDQRKADKEAAEAAKAMAKLRAEQTVATLGESAAISEQVTKLREETAQMGLSKIELQALERARLNDSLSAAEQRLQLALSNGVRGEELEAITLQVEALRELKQAKEEGWAKQVAIEARDAAKETAVEWAKVTEQIGQGLTDSLFRAFEAGRGFFSTLWDGIKNLFKTTVLKLAMQPVQAGISSAVGGLMAGFSGTASASGGSGITGMLGSLGGTVGTLGSDVLGSMMGAGTTGAYGGLAATVGAAVPYIAAAGALVAAFKALQHKATPHLGSAVAINADGSARTLSRSENDILNNYNADTDAALRGLGGATVGSLNSLGMAFGGAGGFSASTAFAADGKDASIGKFLLSRNGQQLAGGVQRDAGNYKLYSSDREAAFTAYTTDVAAATRAALSAVGLPEWAREQFEKLGSAATIEQFAALADAVTATQGALTDLRKGVLPLGGVFANVASLSGDALYQLTEFAGGIEAFAAQAAGFVSAYYSADEQAAIKAGSVFGALSASGLDLAGLNTREEYRALVESRDLATEQGRQQLAVLLAQADAFAQISDYLAANGGTLYSLSQQAPSNDISGLLGPGTGGSGTASVGLDSVVTAVTDSNAQVVDAIERLAEHITAGLAHVAGNTQRSTDYLRDIYEDGAGGGGA